MSTIPKEVMGVSSASGQPHSLPYITSKVNTRKGGSVLTHDPFDGLTISIHKEALSGRKALPAKTRLSL